MTFQNEIQKQLENGFSQVENHQNRRFIGARIEDDGTMTIVAIAKDHDGAVKSQVISDAKKNNPKAFAMASKFKERGLW